MILRSIKRYTFDFRFVMIRYQVFNLWLLLDSNHNGKPGALCSLTVIQVGSIEYIGCVNKHGSLMIITINIQLSDDADWFLVEHY